MAEMRNQNSSCTAVVASEAEPCKLPLLDGEPNGTPETITTEVELLNASRIHEVCRQDRPLLYGMICTAWALLLRCYTGQDHVTFEYQHSMKPKAPLLCMIFDEEATLTDCVKKAEDAIPCAEQKRKDAAADAVPAKSNMVSTTVCIDDADPSGWLGAKADDGPQQVSDSNSLLGSRFSWLF